MAILSPRFGGVLKAFHQPNVKENLFALIENSWPYHQGQPAIIDEVLLGQYASEYNAKAGINHPSEIKDKLIGLGAKDEAAKTAAIAIKQCVSTPPQYAIFSIPFYPSSTPNHYEMDIITTGYNANVSSTLFHNNFNNLLALKLLNVLGGKTMNSLIQCLFNFETPPLFFAEEDEEAMPV